MSSDILSSSNSDLKGYLYVLLHVSLRSYCPFLESYITPESLTHTWSSVLVNTAVENQDECLLKEELQP